MALFSTGSIRRVLTVLVCLAVLPALLIIIFSGFELRRTAIENAKREVLLLVRTMGEVQKGITRSTRQIFSTLGKMQEVHDMDEQACNELFRAIVADNPIFISIAAVDATGEMFAASLPFERVNLADRRHVSEALTHRDFAAGEYIRTRIGTEHHSMAFAYPVLDEAGQVRLVLVAALRLENFAQLFDLADLNPDSFVAVTDRNGIRLFFHPAREATNPIGEPIAGVAWEQVQGAPAPGLSVHTGSDGMRRIFGYQPVRLYDDHPPYAYLWAGVPESDVLQPANQILLRNLVLMVLVAALALVIANLAGGRALLKPIRRLVGATQAIAGGDLDARAGEGPAPDELRTLGRTFDEMAAALVENQEQLNTIADYTYDWEYWIGPDGRPLWVSPSCERITGYTAAEFMADPSLFERIVHTEDQAAFTAHHSQEEDIGCSGRIDFRIVHRSGRVVWIDHHCLGLKTAVGKVLGRRVSNRDITDRKQIEQALRVSETQFRSLVEGAPVAIFVQTDFNFVYVNAAGLKLFGAETQDLLIGTPVPDRVHPDFRALSRERMVHLNERKSAVPRVEQIYLRLDGTQVPVEVSSVPITFQGRDGGLAFVQDISQRRQMETRLQQAQKMEAIGALAGGIAHDFNNILFPIIGLSELLLEDLPRGSLERENVAEIHTAARRAGDLVNQILSFSRQAEHKRIPLRMQQVLKEVGKLVRATIPSNIVIEQSIQADCGPVLADPTNIHQIAMNLVTNAFHAVEEKGGTIAIGLRQTTLALEDVAGTHLTAGPHALFSVWDTGCGIPADVIPRIFDPYFTTKAQGKGTGLGLAVVYGIVREHGGDVRVYSEMNRGTIFKVYLPILPREAEADAGAAPAPLPTGTERILLVDDEAPIVRLETQMLERLGYRVTARTSSVEALAAFQADPAGFDLLISDMAMPNMTGEQLAQQVAAIRPDIPVILCTGFSEQMTVRTAQPEPLRGFLMKPLVRGELAKEVRRLLDDVQAGAGHPRVP
ncbi:PAS domain S-box protein [Desulfatitalea alkaliphila]|uniref:histidine kinase n=1 Tax=Desulfatitalea alkaliphila TaxID=2929485 RepID=A0AA41UJA7_9BACT|nr:PAS domain S-box protein [Desulfatitalea alkaliphila]MCJ8500352.1 PAS domain S-box protein [Desulfatitalea alkaliphila]